MTNLDKVFPNERCVGIIAAFGSLAQPVEQRTLIRWSRVRIAHGLPDTGTWSYTDQVPFYFLDFKAFGSDPDHTSHWL